jgi:hypothetical protein
MSVYSTFVGISGHTGQLVKKVANIWWFFPISNSQDFKLLGIGSVLVIFVLSDNCDG